MRSGPGDPVVREDAIERLLLALLPVRGVPAAERAVVTAVRECVAAEWVALFRADSGKVVCRACDGPGPAVGSEMPPQTADEPVGSALVLRQLEHGASLLVAPSAQGVECGDHAMLDRLREAVEIALRNAALIDRLQSQASVDSLTECYNRRAFDEFLRIETVRARRYRRTMALLLLDLDNFKHLNDDFGHPVGDHALRRVASLLLGAFRTTDVVCRLGGDEFAVIFPETTKQDAKRLATRLRARVEATFPDELIPCAVTASLGVGAFPADGEESQQLIRAVDHALYVAKSEGRNRVACV